MPFESKTKYGTQRDNTQLILRTLESIKRAISAGNITADLTTVENLLSSIDTELNSQSTLAAQQSQTTLLTSIDTELNTQTTELNSVNSELNSQTTLLSTIDNNTLLLTLANSPSHEVIVDPSSESFTGFKELNFVCSGAITVTLDGNSIMYPYTLVMPDATNAYILGTPIKADTVSNNSVTFNGIGTVLITQYK